MCLCSNKWKPKNFKYLSLLYKPRYPFVQDKVWLFDKTLFCAKIFNTQKCFTIEYCQVLANEGSKATSQRFWILRVYINILMIFTETYVSHVPFILQSLHTSTPPQNNSFLLNQIKYSTTSYFLPSFLCPFWLTYIFNLSLLENTSLTGFNSLK